MSDFMLSHEESVRLLQLLEDHHEARSRGDVARFTDLADEIHKYPTRSCADKNKHWKDFYINPSAVEFFINTEDSSMAQFMYDTIPMSDAQKVYLKLKWVFDEKT